MLIRLCYASLRADHQNLLKDLSDILVKSRAYNQKLKIFGVLYYANNAFFQCLEGEKTAVLNLFAKIKKDSRHQNLLLLEEKELTHVSFHSWTMKYVQENEQVDLFFKEKSISGFKPHYLKIPDLYRFVEILLETQESQGYNVKQGYKNRGYQNFF